MCTVTVVDDDEDDVEKGSVSQGFVKQVIPLRHSDYITCNAS
jgi:hypothetical protein